MKVFVVCHGESGEGFGIVAIHASLDEAVRVAMEQEAYFGDCKWHPVRNTPYLWENGCDYLSIKEYEVR